VVSAQAAVPQQPDEIALKLRKELVSPNEGRAQDAYEILQFCTRRDALVAEDGPRRQGLAVIFVELPMPTLCQIPASSGAE
jgi:hypothetical protein